MTSSGFETGQHSSRSLFKNILGSSGLYSLTLVGQRVAGMALLPIYTRYLTPANYGTLELLDQVVAVLSILLGANFSSALAYFYFEKDSTENREAASGTVVAGSLLIGTLVGAVGWVFSGVLSKVVFGSDGYVLFLRISFGGIVLSFLFEAIMSWFRVTDRSGAYSLAALARMLLQIAGALVLVMAFRWGVTGVLLGNLAATGVTAVALLVLFVRWVPLRPDLGMFIRMLRFAAPIALSCAAVFIIHFGDRFFLRNYRSLADVGVYALAYKIGMLISFVHSSFHTYWSNQIYHILKREDSEMVFARAFTYMVAALSFCALALIVAAEPGVRILATQVYARAATLVPVIVAAYLVRAIGDFFRCLFYVVNRPSYDAICNWLGAAACLAGYFLLIPKFGMSGAALATLISFLLVGILVIPWTHHLRPFRLEAGRLVKIAVAAGLPLGLFFLVRISPVLAQVAWGAMLLLLYPAILLLLRFPTPGESTVAASALRRAARAVRIA